MIEEKGTSGRQLKIRGVDEEVVGEGKSVKSVKKESKVWVLVVLIVSVLISLLFSLKAGGASWWGRVFRRDEKNELNRTIEPGTVERRGGGLFGPAVYELD